MMRTWLTIMAVVLAVAAATVGGVVVLVLMFGWLGLAIGALETIAVLVAYRLWIQPMQHRWGATDEEVRRAMPGDDLMPHAASTTRAITIAAPAEQVWPWLVQLGYGRGGWYSYDWLDNGRQPSAMEILPAFQHMEVGDVVAMTLRNGQPYGPPVLAVGPPNHAGSLAVAATRGRAGAHPAAFPGPLPLLLASADGRPADRVR
jgi:hypothetical protein